MDFSSLAPYYFELAKGTLLTLQLSVSAMLLGTAVAIPAAWARAYGAPVVKRIVGLYVDAIRNTPLLIQIYLVFFGLPTLGIKLSANTASLLALTLNVGAYATEILKAGITSIAVGQREAAIALGLSRSQVFRLVVLRPSVKAVYPALSGQFIILMLFSSLVSVVSADDLSSVASHVQSITFRSFEVYLVVTGLYFLLSCVLSAVFALIYVKFIDFPVR